MKALCVKQPYAEWIRQGEKTLEIRSWITPFRGQFILCASKIVAFKIAEQFKTGVVIGLVELIDIVKFMPEHEKLAKCEWRENLYAWKVKYIRDLPNISVKGQLNLFNLEINRL